ncbi:MAG: right-handed parallel beta-helix repeat-containing protein [Candidatus Eisenbacteria bacterium]
MTRDALLPALLCVSTLSCFPSLAAATELLVPQDYPTIQEAVDASQNGDVVLVAPGTYSGPGNRDLDPGTKNIAILGAEGPDQTVIDCESAGRALWVHGGQSLAFQFSGFAVRNGVAGTGAGFLVESGAQASISKCVFENCTATAYSVCVGSGELSQTRISNSGGPRALEWRVGSIMDCEILDNSGIGLLTDHPTPGELLVQGTVISGNGEGLVLNSEEVDSVVENCVISNNGGGNNLALACDSARQIIIRNSTIAGGGRMEVFLGNVEFDRCILSEMGCDGLWNYGNDIVFNCCLFTPSDINSGGFVVENGSTDEDPGYCDPSACFPSTHRSDYGLNDRSPCLAANSPCGEQIGAFGLECDISGIDEVVHSGIQGIVFTSSLPAHDTLRFRLPFASEGDDTVELSVVTLSGRRVASRVVTPTAGSAEFEWRPEAQGVELESGIYLLHAVARSGASASAKFVWLR